MAHNNRQDDGSDFEFEGPFKMFRIRMTNLSRLRGQFYADALILCVVAFAGAMTYNQIRGAAGGGGRV